MRVLVTFAVEAEFAPWRKLRAFKKGVLGRGGGLPGFPGFKEERNEHSVEVLLTGMGRKTCQETLAQYDFSRMGRPDVVISSGLAGALRPGFVPGDTVAPKRVHTLNNDADGLPDAGLFEQLVQQGARPIETMITSKELVKTAEEKARVGFFGEAVDMESAYVMMMSSQAGIPSVTVRTISDGAEEDLPIDFDRCLTPRGAVRPLQLLNSLVERRTGLPRLIRFGRQSHQAAYSLCRFLDEFLTSVTHVEAGAR